MVKLEQTIVANCELRRMLRLFNKKLFEDFDGPTLLHRVVRILLSLDIPVYDGRNHRHRYMMAATTHQSIAK